MDPVYSGPEMKARSSGGVGRPVLDIETLLAEDPFFYGYRWVGDEQVPLTEDDLLDPQEGDHVSEHTCASTTAPAGRSSRSRRCPSDRHRFVSWKDVVFRLPKITRPASKQRHPGPGKDVVRPQTMTSAAWGRPSPGPYKDISEPEMLFSDVSGRLFATDNVYLLNIGCLFPARE